MIASYTQPSLRQEFWEELFFFCRFNNSTTLPLIKINEYSPFPPGPLHPQKRASFKYNMPLPSSHPSFLVRYTPGLPQRSGGCSAMPCPSCTPSPHSAHPDHRFFLGCKWVQLSSVISFMWRISHVTPQYLKCSLKPHFVPDDSKKQTISTGQVHELNSVSCGPVTYMVLLIK